MTTRPIPPNLPPEYVATYRHRNRPHPTPQGGAFLNGVSARRLGRPRTACPYSESRQATRQFAVAWFHGWTLEGGAA